MILNPSHEITLKGLPSEILDAYVRYKKGSRAIVAWLVRYGPKKYQGAKTLPIKELASLAACVVQSIKELPEVIHFHFRETIAARKRLSQFFRKSVDVSTDDVDTVNHEHFTTSLTKIYFDLCEHCQNREKCALANSNLSNSSSLSQTLKNHYACLPVEDSSESYTLDYAEPGCDECQREQSYQCLGSQDGLVLENDDMSTAIETASTLEHIQNTMAAVDSVWRKAGTKEAHIVSAAGATNAAWSNLRDLETKLRADDEDLNIGVLHQRCCLFSDAAGNEDSPLTQVHALLESLVESDRAITHYSNSHKLTVISHCPSCIQKPGDYIQQTEVGQRTSFPVALIDNMLHLMCGIRPGSIVLQGSPIFAEIGYLLTHRDDKSTSFRCILAIHLLTTSYKAYISSLPVPSTVSLCRISALKLSKQASSAIEKALADKDSFPCGCPQTLAFHLSNLKDELDAYTKHKCWDLYFQSPWVAGNHIIEMLDVLSYYGMRLFHYRHYIGSILHSYNVLVQLAGLERIAPLEFLCETFHDAFFPSGRPTSHFKNSWARYIGARLKFKKGHKRHGASDKESWCMAVPAHAARNSAGFGLDADRTKNNLEPNFDYARFDPTMRLKQVDWRVASLPTKNTNAQRPPSSSSFSYSTITTPMSNLSITSSSSGTPTSSHPLHTILQDLDARISPQPSTPNTSRISTTPLSHLAIFTTALNLIRIITSKLHTDPSSKESKLCICFAQTLLSAADRIVEGRRFGGVECWRKEEREVVDIVRAVLEEGFGEEVEKRWMWEF